MINIQKDREKSIEKRVRFDIVRYASCWEDADILLQALNVKAGGVYLSIASAGDNSLSILSRNPSLVLAIDINPVQLACVEIRKVTFKNLSYDNILTFLGVKEAKDRLLLYKQLRTDLSNEARKFWDEHPLFIKQGLIHIGKFENYFRLFRKYVLPLIHNKRTVEQLLNIRDTDERINFYNNRWNTKRWKLLFKIFFSRKMMGRLGRDPEFFKYVETDVADRIFKRAEYALTILPADKNPYLEYILTGNFRNSLPFYLRRENFDSIRNNLDKLTIFKGNLQQAFEAYPKIRFDGFNLSDIFEYMSYQEYQDELIKVLNVSKSSARIAYWNMLADRKYVDELRGKVKFLDLEADELFKQDKAFFYKSLIIGEAI